MTSQNYTNNSKRNDGWPSQAPKSLSGNLLAFKEMRNKSLPLPGNSSTVELPVCVSPGR